MEITSKQIMDIVFIGVNDTEKVQIAGYLDTSVRMQMANNYQQAEALISDTQPELVFCDVEKPELDARKLHTDGEYTTWVFLSSRNKNRERRKSLLGIKDCYLTRPLSKEQIQKAIKASNDVLH